MKKLVYFSLVAAALTLSVACQQKEASNVNEASALGTKPAAKTAAPVAAEAAPAASADLTGVPECDDYIKKYEACIQGKVPPQAQAAMKASFDAQRKAWKDAAANPQAKASLAAGCSQALTLAKQSMGSYGCAW